MTTPDRTWTCAHCGHQCGDYEGGYGAVIDGNGVLRASCHPNDLSRPDCYRRVTVYGEAVGALLGVVPLPAGVKDIRGDRTPPRAFPLTGPEAASLREG